MCLEPPKPMFAHVDSQLLGALHHEVWRILKPGSPLERWLEGLSWEKWHPVAGIGQVLCHASVAGEECYIHYISCHCLCGYRISAVTISATAILPSLVALNRRFRIGRFESCDSNVADGDSESIFRDSTLLCFDWFFCFSVEFLVVPGPRFWESCNKLPFLRAMGFLGHQFRLKLRYYPFSKAAASPFKGGISPYLHNTTESEASIDNLCEIPLQRETIWRNPCATQA